MITAGQLDKVRIAFLSCERISSGRMYAVPVHLVWSVARHLAQAAQETRARGEDGEDAMRALREVTAARQHLAAAAGALTGEEEQLRADLEQFVGGKISTAEQNDRYDEPTRDEPEPAHITPAVAARREIDDFAEELAAQLDEAGLEQLALLVRRVRPR